MVNADFFQHRTEQSRVKTAIVTRYFSAWANVIIGSQRKNPRIRDQRIGFVDLFCGPGYYEEGVMSTPLIILDKTISNKEISDRLLTIFNDTDRELTAKLENAIHALPGMNSLAITPKIFTNKLDSHNIDFLDECKNIPTIYFIDPWGYKGLSLRLVTSLIQNWGSECIFFFNYKRINMSLSNELFNKNMSFFFGTERAAKLSVLLGTITSPKDREAAIIEYTSRCIKNMGVNYVLPFSFKDSTGNRTSHHIFYLTKAQKGLAIMKEIMGKLSSKRQRGVPLFDYNPIEGDDHGQQSLDLDLNNPIEELKNLLLETFEGRILTRKEIFETHHGETRFIERNYRIALMELEAEGNIQVSPHPKSSFGPNVIVTFPSKPNKD